ncbi:MAG: preprotein translocase subunit SecE [Rubrobacteridae bacterium]|nr:preprotein translocase subunit SecE [Rubrobacteridae bacterium]
MSEKKTAVPAKTKGEGAGKFLRDVRVELSKVIWPGKDEVVSSTIVVLVAVAFFAIYIGLLDQVFVRIINLISA